MEFIGFNGLNPLNWFRGGEKQFFRQNTNYQIGTKGPVFIDSWVPYKLVNEIPTLNLVLNKRAAMFANGVFKLQDIKSGKIEPLPESLQRLLESPNPMQNQNEWLRTTDLQKCAFGNAFLYKNQASAISDYPATLTYLPPSCTAPVLTGKIYDQVSIDGIISGYEVTENGAKTTKKTSEVLWLKVSDIDNPVIGISPLKSLKYPLSNTKAAFDYFNAISTAMGALGVLSNRSKDGMGALPISKEERDALERSYTEEYGKGDGQKKIHVSSASLEFSPFSYPTKDLLLQEQIDANTLILIDIFGLNVNIFSSKSQTYENVVQALRQCYNDTIIVAADGFTQALTPFVGVSKVYPGKRLILDYSHLAILSNEYKNLSQKATALTQLVQAGLISKEQADIVISNEIGIEAAKNGVETPLMHLSRLAPHIATGVLASMSTAQKLELVGLTPDAAVPEVIAAPVA